MWNAAQRRIAASDEVQRRSDAARLPLAISRTAEALEVTQDMLGALVATLVFGVAYGAAAAAAGFSPAFAAATSAAVFAGTAQYAALELWHSPLPVVAILVTVVAINVRHVALGATLDEVLERKRPFKRYAALFLLSEANWAAAQQARSRGRDGFTHLLLGGALLWLAWLAGTLVGAVAARSLGDLERLGADTIMPAFFACALLAMVRERAQISAAAVAVIVSGLGSLVIPAHWSIMLGALVGTAGATRNVAK
jgi:predicted branched-subunit amino acid permease